MTSSHRLRRNAIRIIFIEEIDAQHGRVESIVDDGRRLYCRATLPLTDEVAPGDRIKGGAALRATASGALISPFLLRVVCANGVIVSQSLGARHIVGFAELSEEDLEGAIRDAIRTSCAQEVFAEAAEMIRAARGRGFRGHQMALRQLLRRDFTDGIRLIPEVMNRFRAEGDRSAFGLMNAVTSVARDTADPETRWRLEALGGAIAAGRLPVPSRPGDAVLRLIEAERAAMMEERRRVPADAQRVAASEQTCEVDCFI
jgi:hypothetical protein